MTTDFDYWLIDKDGKPSQCCGPLAVAERQKAFFDSLFPNHRPFTIQRMSRREPDEIPEQTWRTQRRPRSKTKLRQRYPKLLDQGVRPAKWIN